MIIISITESSSKKGGLRKSSEDPQTVESSRNLKDKPSSREAMLRKEDRR
jgi:hypothetical protein